MELPRGAVMLDHPFGAATVVNATDATDADVAMALHRQENELFQAMQGWVENTRPLTANAAGSWETGGYGGGGSHGRNGGLFHRDRFVAPTGVYNEMSMAALALDDDIVAGVAESTESLAFSKISFYASDPDEQDIYNQIAATMDLDSRLREIWHELFTYSQAYVAVWWNQESLKVRGTTKNGVARRRTYELRVPTDVTLLDPLKIVPVGNPMFGKERLAYRAERIESGNFLGVRRGEKDDALVQRLIREQYDPSRDRAESAELTSMGVDVNNLWYLSDTDVFRHTLTRPGYKRFSKVRLRAVFELLDLKHQLRQMERAHLIGATNFIVLVTKGSDERPALPQEIANLQAQVRTVARVPILVGDHRLHVEIITPKLDNTLRAERHNTLDSRITARLYTMFMLGNYSAGAGGDDSVKLVKVIARGMESRRHMIRRSFEQYIFDPLYEKNDELNTRPKLQFHPRSIALDFDAAYASFLFDLRQANDLSRETILNQFDLDQDLEAEFRKREKEDYDDVFMTQVPFSSPNPALPGQPGQPPAPGQPPPPEQPVLPKDNGGGRRNGGGAAPGTGQGQTPRRATRPKVAAARQVTIGVTHADGSDMTKAEIIAALVAELDEENPR